MEHHSRERFTRSDFGSLLEPVLDGFKFSSEALVLGFQFIDFGLVLCTRFLLGHSQHALEGSCVHGRGGGVVGVNILIKRGVFGSLGGDAHDGCLVDGRGNEDCES